MQEYTRMTRGTLSIGAAVGVALLLAACGGNTGNNTAANGSDTTLQMANGQAQGAQPQLNDRAQSGAEEGSGAPHHRRRAAADTTTETSAGAVAPAATHGSIPAGTALMLASNARVCTNNYHVGDTFTANTTDAVMGSSGATIPAGTPVTLTVTQVKSSNNMTQAGHIGISVDSVDVNGVSYPVVGQITSAQTDKSRSTSMGQEATKVGIGAAAGGILGQVIGHNAKSTIIGAAAGALAGTGAAAATTKYDFCIPQRGKIGVKLSSDVTM
jgi:hypothetical protein